MNRLRAVFQRFTPRFESPQHGRTTDKRSVVRWIREANCWDNAVMEHFFLNLKMERVWHRQYANPTEAIRNFFNSRRLHSSLGYLPPNNYEFKMARQQPIDVSEKS